MNIMFSKVPAWLNEPLGQGPVLRTQICRMLSEVNQAIVRMADEAELFPLVCRIVVAFSGVRMAWIGEHKPAMGCIVPVQAYGEGTDYLRDIVNDCPEGQGPAATAFRKNQPVLISRFATDSMAELWRDPGQPVWLG